MRSFFLFSGGAAAVLFCLGILSTASAQSPPVPTPANPAYPSWSTAVNFSPDGRYVVAWGDIKNLETDKTTSFEGALRLAFTADGKRLYGIFRNQTLKCWDTDGLKERFAVKADHGPENSNRMSFYTHGLVVTPDGRYVATYRPAGPKFKVWDGATGKEVRTLAAESTVWSLAISPDGKLIAAGDEHRRVRIWNLDSGKIVETYETPFRDFPYTSDGIVNQLCFSPDGKDLAAGTSRINEGDVGPYRCELAVRNLVAKQNRFLIDVDVVYQLGLAYRRDGRQIATAGYKNGIGCVKYWSAETGKAQGERSVNDREHIHGVAYHPDGKRVAVVFHNEPILRVWPVP